MATPADVRIIAPEFAGKTDEEIQFFIDIAVLSCDEIIWGDFYNPGVCYLTAHLLTRSANGGSAAGPVQSEKVGDLSRTYAVSSGGNALGSTAYGAEYLRLRSTLALSPVVADADPILNNRNNRVIIV